MEDGSLDAEELAEEGIAPGRVIVYRQGANEPHFLDFGSLPSDFREEEERLSKRVHPRFGRERTFTLILFAVPP